VLFVPATVTSLLSLDPCLERLSAAGVGIVVAQLTSCDIEDRTSTEKEDMMESYNVPLNMRDVGIASLVFGFLGGAFYWWTPLGMVLSLCGLVMGFVGWTLAGRRAAGFGLLIVGILLSVVTLILDSVIAGLGLELVKFNALR
jgi:hypothetical protein